MDRVDCHCGWSRITTSRTAGALPDPPIVPRLRLFRWLP